MFISFLIKEECMNRNHVLVFLFTWMVFAFSCGDKEKAASGAKKVEAATAGSSKVKTILFFGNSLTAGYGVEPSQAFPALIQHKIDSLGLSYKVVNAGVSGETSAGGNSRIDWILKQQPVDVFVLELGANDGLRGLPVDETKRNLQSIIDKVKLKYPGVKLVLAGMQVPPNMGQKYVSDFQAIFPALAHKNQMALIPFLLEKVGGEVKLNQEDGIHPTPEGHRILAENVWSVLKKEVS